MKLLKLEFYKCRRRKILLVCAAVLAAEVVWIASTFARIFFRNALNIGLPILECDEAAKNIREGDTVSVDFTTGVITNETTGRTFQAEPFPPFMQNLIACGGLVNYSKEKIEKLRAAR